MKGELNWESPQFRKINFAIAALSLKFEPTRKIGGRYAFEEEFYRELSEYRFVNEGYLKWIECAEKQRNYMNDPEVHKLFCLGLKSLRKCENISRTYVVL